MTSNVERKKLIQEQCSQINFICDVWKNSREYYVMTSRILIENTPEPQTSEFKFGSFQNLLGIFIVIS